MLDLFSGAGGAARGYQLAGFHVTGVDNRPMPRYAGNVFIQADAIAVLENQEFLRRFDAIHASPPCQRYSQIPQCRKTQESWSNLIGPVRELLVGAGKPWVIENVGGAPLMMPAMLCGSMFGLKTYRHRFFESSTLFFTPEHSPHKEKCPPAGRRGIQEGSMISICGHISQMTYARKVMGIDWMTRDELAQAIPPKYTEFIGHQLRNVV